MKLKRTVKFVDAAKNINGVEVKNHWTLKFREYRQNGDLEFSITYHCFDVEDVERITKEFLLGNGLDVDFFNPVRELVAA